MPNHLATENSPYLLQHANNPVDWYPWGEVALNKAKIENKPIFLSIGYAACHWCHRMREESFEDPETAALMNQEFISIKVDREERPDVDGIYMQATVAMTGSGDLADLLLEQAGVALLPGTSFGKYGEGYLRLSYANSIENIEKGLRQIQAALAG